MCIRDRVHIVRNIIERHFRLNHPELCQVAGSIGTVSYTHLDVYKRQELREILLCQKQHSERVGTRQGGIGIDGTLLIFPRCV